MNIYVGNLSWNLKDQDLSDLFTPYGEVTSGKIVMDKFTQRSKGFGFVEMPNDEQAQAAIAQLNNSEVDGRNLVVNESRPKEGGSDGGSGFKKRSFGGGGGGFKKGAVVVVVVMAGVAVVVEVAVVDTVVAIVAAAAADTEIIIK